MPTLQKKDRKLLVRTNQPIEYKGMLFYPLTMQYYEEFAILKNSLTIRLSTLPVKYMSRDYLSALFSLELDNKLATGQALGIVEGLLRFLYRALRVDYDPIKATEQIVLSTKGQEIVIEHITVWQEGKEHQIKPIDFSFGIRKILADQNGIDLPREDENPELIKSYEQKKALTSSNVELNINNDDLIASVAYNSHVREMEIYQEWTIREFEFRRRAIDRDKKYLMYGQAEMSGMVTFKKGNPVPSWTYDVIDNALGTMSMSELKEQTQTIKEQT